MKERTFYEVAEIGGSTGGAMLLDNPFNQVEGLRWNRFKTFDRAKERIDKAIKDRKTQWFYFRDSNNKIVNKISYYERYKIAYKIYKIVEQEEVVFNCNNDDVTLKQVDSKLQEETDLW